MVSFGCCAFLSPQGEIPALISAKAWARKKYSNRGKLFPIWSFSPGAMICMCVSLSDIIRGWGTGNLLSKNDSKGGLHNGDTLFPFKPAI